MMERRVTKKSIFCVLLALLLFVLQGCGNQTISESDNAGDSQVSQAENTQEDANAEREIYDSSVREGKLAVYYFASVVPDIATWMDSHNAGDAMLIVCPDGTTAMIDCDTQINASYIVARLKEMGIEKIDHFFGSHAHSDHIGGVVTLLKYIDIGTFYCPPENVMDDANYMWVKIKDELQKKNIPIQYLSTGDVLNLANDVDVTIYNPDVDLRDHTNYDGNEYSLVMKMVYGDSSYLFTGDTDDNAKVYGRATETELEQRFGKELSADVYKVGHHGTSNTGRRAEWLDLIDAKVIVTTSCSVQDILQHWMCIEASEVNLTTALEGDIVITTEGDGAYDVLVEKERTNTAYYGELNTKDGWITVD